MEKISQQDRALLNTNFGEDLEKEAAARATVFTEAYNYGLSKLAAETADEMDKAKEEEEKKEKEDESEEKKASGLDREEEKTAAEIGAFIERGYFEGLRKLGSERHGDEMHYLAPLLIEKMATDAYVKTALSAAEALQKLKEVGQGAAKKVKNYHTGMVANARQAITGNPVGAAGAPFGQHILRPLSGKERAMEAGLAAAKASPYAILAGGAGYGATKAFGGKKEQK